MNEWNIYSCHWYNYVYISRHKIYSSQDKRAVLTNTESPTQHKNINKATKVEQIDVLM